MQQNCVANLACLPGLDLTSLFLPQNDPHIYDFNPLDMVGPYSCNASTIISSMSVGTADDQERLCNDERKKRRLASNRESARRSRVRKQRRLNDLSSQVAELLDTNQRLLVELHHKIAKHARIVRENAKLREEAADLQKRLSEMEEAADLQKRLNEREEAADLQKRLSEMEEAAAATETPGV